MLKLGLASLTIAIMAGCGVYGLKNRVQVLEKELVAVERKIEKERIEIRRLKAEWATLSHPERLARLAEKHLQLKPAEPRQIMTIADIPMRDGLEGTPEPALVSSVGPSEASYRPRTSYRQ
jgi:cell division protein FtsL